MDKATKFYVSSNPQGDLERNLRLLLIPGVRLNREMRNDSAALRQLFTLLNEHKHYFDCGGYAEENNFEHCFDIVCKGIPLQPDLLLRFYNWMSKLEQVLGYVEQCHVLTPSTNSSNYQETTAGFVRFCNYTIHPLLVRLLDRSRFFGHRLFFEVSFKPMGYMRRGLDFVPFRVAFEDDCFFMKANTQHVVPRQYFLQRALWSPPHIRPMEPRHVIFRRVFRDGRFETHIEPLDQSDQTEEDTSSSSTSSDVTVIYEPHDSILLRDVIKAETCVCKRQLMSLKTSDLRLLYNCGHIICSSCAEESGFGEVNSLSISCPRCRVPTSRHNLIKIRWSA